MLPYLPPHHDVAGPEASPAEDLSVPMARLALILVSAHETVMRGALHPAGSLADGTTLFIRHSNLLQHSSWFGIRLQRSGSTVFQLSPSVRTSWRSLQEEGRSAGWHPLHGVDQPPWI